MKKEYKNVSPLDLIHILPDFPSIYKIYLKIFIEIKRLENLESASQSNVL